MSGFISNDTVWFFRQPQNDTDTPYFYRATIRIRHKNSDNEPVYELLCETPFVIGFAHHSEVFETLLAVTQAVHTFMRERLLKRREKLVNEIAELDKQIVRTRL
jgi:hypothetical protein